MKYYLSLLITIFVVLIIIAFVYFFGNSIWQDFIPNFLATILGAIIGIPIAIGINNHLEQTAEKQQWNKILPLLREELLVNLSHLSTWQKSKNQKIETIYTSIFLETSSWNIFSNSGDVTSAKNPKLLNQLTHAYDSIHIVKQLTERYMDLVHLPDEKEKELLSALIAQLISKGIDYSIEEISIAIKAM